MTERMDQKARPASEIAGFRRFEIDVVIPVGPSPRDREKMLPLSLYVPKPLVYVGTRPMIWHILRQISEIDAHVNTVHVLILKEREHHDWQMVKSYVEWLKQIPDLPISKKIRIRVNESNMMCDEISQLEFDSSHFLLHFDDILLPADSGMLENLVTFHLREEEKNGVVGTLAYSRSYPMQIGLIKQSEKENRMASLVEKSPMILGELWYRRGRAIEEVCINMAISVFRADFARHLEKQGNDFYRVIGSLDGVQFGIFEHVREWYHVDTMNELYQTHVKSFEKWTV